MLLEGAISPQGWSLSALKVLEAAVLSVSEWQSAERTCESQAQIRARAIGHVRRLALFSSVVVANNGEDVSDDAEEEVSLVRSTIAHWTDKDEVQAQVPWRTSGTEPSSRLSAPSEQEITLDSSGRRPENKRRMARGDTTQTSLSSTSLVVGNSSDIQSATHRFLQRPELLSLVLDQLEFEQVDIITLSTVSKQMRTVALPRLVRSINLPITKAFDLMQLLRANAGLVEYIRYLRLWDPLAHHYARTGEGLASSQAPPHFYANTWNHFGDLLMMVQQRQTSQIPFLDLSCGQISMYELYIQLKRAPRLLERLSALRVLPDFTSSRYPGIADAVSLFHHHGEAISEELSDLLHMVLDMQDSAGSDALKVFHFEGFDLSEGGRDSVLPALRPRLLKRLAMRIENLYIAVPQAAESDMATFTALLAASWSKLRHFQLDLQSRLPSQHGTFKAKLLDFLYRHNQLVEVFIDIEEDAEMADPFDWANFSLPQLRSCFFFDFWPDNMATFTFARRHGFIQEITLGRDGSCRAFSSPEALKSLRSLRMHGHGHDCIGSFLSAGAPLTQVNMMVAWNDATRIPASLCFDARLSSTITSVSLDFRFTGSTGLTRRLESLFNAGLFPAMAELVIRYAELVIRYANVEKPQDSAASAQDLANILKALSNCPTTALRAISIDSSTADALPNDDELSKVIAEIPSSLEYVSWTTRPVLKIQYFRVLPTPTQGALQFSSSSTSLLSLPQLQERRRLQRLPDSFRPIPNKKTGAWEALDEEADATLIFDHKDGVPRPRNS
ncbi:hypothetical protein CF319_g8465 [Tilletia indica]|nr:hypothetical protein CF319_g8465 [Tilletia indica]